MVNPINLYYDFSEELGGISGPSDLIALLTRFLHFPPSVILPPSQMNLATTSAAQLISRSQSVSSPSATTLTQSVLLGNTTSPPLNQSQAQMYLRVRDVHAPLLPLVKVWASSLWGRPSSPDQTPGRCVLLCVRPQAGDLDFQLCSSM